MIKNIKIFANDDFKSNNVYKLVKDKFISSGFIISDSNYDLGIAIGGDGSFLRMVKANDFNSDIYYIGINTGTLGFLQEIKVNEVDSFIEELQNNKYKVDDIYIQETEITCDLDKFKYYSLNEIVLRNIDLGIIKLDININNNLLEHYVGDGILIATSTGSTAHNLSYGGSIVYPTFSSLQITPIGPINSKVYNTLVNSVIVPSNTFVNILPHSKNLIITVDGVNYNHNNVDKIHTMIGNKKIKCLRLNKYNFPQKINEKMLKK